MRGRRTNLALAVLLVLGLVTGLLAFGFGTAAFRWVTILHGVAGVAIVLLVPWKSMVVVSGVQRDRPGTAWSITFGVLVVVSLVSGFLFSSGLVLRYGPLTAIQVHVGSAVVAIPLLMRHMRDRPVRPKRVDVERRSLLRAGAVMGSAAVVWAGFEGVMRVARLPGRDRRFTGSHERGSFMPRAMPVTQWFDDSVQRIDRDVWSLLLITPQGEWRVGFDEVDVGHALTAVLDCTGGWYSEQEWEGIRLDRLLGDDGRSFVVRSATGYRRRFPLSDAGSMLLATRVGGEPLSAGHGAPARIVAPGRRGFWWVKWVTEIEVDDRSWWVQSPMPFT